MEILIVEDDKLSINILETAISRKFKCHFDTAENGEEGLKLSTKKKYDFIVTDLRMPVMSGEQFIIETRGFNINKNTPIIITTGYPDIYLDEFKEFLPVYLLEKPLKFNFIFDLLNKFK